MKILKELIFGRVKAYNMVQVFHFFSETLESYYCLSYSVYLITDFIHPLLSGFRAYMLLKSPKRVF